MTEDTCIFTVTVRTQAGRTELGEYVTEVGATITDEVTIEPEEEYSITIKLTDNKYEIPVIEEGMAQIDGVEVESCQIIDA